LSGAAWGGFVIATAGMGASASQSRSQRSLPQFMLHRNNDGLLDRQIKGD
jgi:hypothetical protein